MNQPKECQTAQGLRHTQVDALQQQTKILEAMNPLPSLKIAML